MDAGFELAVVVERVPAGIGDVEEIGALDDAVGGIA